MKTLTLTTTFSKKLQKLSDPPERLYYVGEQLEKVVGSSPVVAVVGTRKPTSYGKGLTQEVVTELAKSEIIVLSGNALGVDVLAQKTALEAGGRVVSVVPSGLDVIYPATNRPVAERIVAEGGCVLSEYEAGHRPRPEEFLARNRIIAALSDFVLIPEAASRSGSLNTAKHANEIGVPVGAFPGNIGNPMSIGTNDLIASGKATLIRSADDVCKVLGIQKTKHSVQRNTAELSDEEQKIYRAIQKHSSATISLLESETQLSTAQFQQSVTLLEIKGIVQKDEASGWRLT